MENRTLSTSILALVLGPIKIDLHQACCVHITALMGNHHHILSLFPEATQKLQPSCPETGVHPADLHLLKAVF